MSVPARSLEEIEVDLGEDSAIVAGASEGVSIAVQVDGSRRIDDRDLPDVLAELGRELGYYTAVSGWLLAKGEEDDSDSTQVVTDGGIDLSPPSANPWRPGPHPAIRRTLAALFLTAAFVHLPLDIGLTALAWALETNPVVLELGPWRWILVKVATVGIAALVWWDATRDQPRWYPILAAGWLGCLIGFGFGQIVLNLALTFPEVVP